MCVCMCAFKKVSGSFRLERKSYKALEAQESGPKLGLYRVCSGANTWPDIAVVHVNGLELQGVAFTQSVM